MTLPEVLVVSLVTLIVMLGALALLDDTKRGHVRILEVSSAEAMGRATLDMFVSETSVAGYDPLGVSFVAIPEADADSLRLLADLDEDGVVGTAGELDENVVYEFRDADSNGVFELRRGVDLNGDGDFDDDSERVDTIATQVVALDVNGASVPFFSYDFAPPLTTRVTITFGVRVKTTLIVGKTNAVRRFGTTIGLRNRQ